MLRTIARIMPALTYDQMSTMETLVAYFEPHMDFGAFDASQGVCVCVCVCVCV